MFKIQKIFFFVLFSEYLKQIQRPAFGFYEFEQLPLIPFENSF